MAAPTASGDGEAKRKMCVVCDDAPRDCVFTACGACPLHGYLGRLRVLTCVRYQLGTRRPLFAV